MNLRLFAIAGVAVAAVLTLNPFAHADDNAGKKKNKKKGPDLEAIFKKLDTDKDGKLSSSEFAGVMDELRKKKDDAEAKKPAKAGKKIDQLFEKLDTDKNGSLSLDEFMRILEVRKEGRKKNK